MRGEPFFGRHVEQRGAVGLRNDDAGSFERAVLAGFDAEQARVVLEDERVLA